MVKLTNSFHNSLCSIIPKNRSIIENEIKVSPLQMRKIEKSLCAPDCTCSGRGYENFIILLNREYKEYSEIGTKSKALITLKLKD